jgi:indole-3-glycerol phosphate synthase
MISTYQVTEAKAIGADVILLIAACLTVQEVRTLSRYAHDLGLEVLLEIHSEAELDRISDSVDMVGINNRNLKTFEVDIETSIRLLQALPAGKPAIAESGISDVSVFKSLQAAGFQGFLMGEHFMKQTDPGAAIGQFVYSLNTAP